MSGPEQAREARRWLRFATEDLIGAQRIVADFTVAPRLACVLAQQAAEKALKAALIFLGTEYPRRHDLRALRELIPLGWEVKTGYEYLADLSEWAVEARYPGDWPEATQAEARDAVQQANAVVQSISNDLRLRGLEVETE